MQAERRTLVSAYERLLLDWSELYVSCYCKTPVYAGNSLGACFAHQVMRFLIVERYFLNNISIGLFLTVSIVY